MTCYGGFTAQTSLPYMRVHHGPYMWSTAFTQIIGTFRSLRFTVGWPLKSCTHTGIFPSVSGPSAVKCKPRKVPNSAQGGVPTCMNMNMNMKMHRSETLLRTNPSHTYPGSLRLCPHIHVVPGSVVRVLHIIKLSSEIFTCVHTGNIWAG